MLCVSVGFVAAPMIRAAAVAAHGVSTAAAKAGAAALQALEAAGVASLTVKSIADSIYNQEHLRVIPAGQRGNPVPSRTHGVGSEPTVTNEQLASACLYLKQLKPSIALQQVVDAICSLLCPDIPLVMRMCTTPLLECTWPPQTLWEAVQVTYENASFEEVLALLKAGCPWSEEPERILVEAVQRWPLVQVKQLVSLGYRGECGAEVVEAAQRANWRAEHISALNSKCAAATPLDGMIV